MTRRLETYSQGQHLPLTAWHQTTGRSNSLGHVNDAPLALDHIIAGRFNCDAACIFKKKYAPGMSRFGEKPENAVVGKRERK
jgi:hypothetical protein